MLMCLLLFVVRVGKLSVWRVYICLAIVGFCHTEGKGRDEDVRVDGDVRGERTYWCKAALEAE